MKRWLMELKGTGKKILVNPLNVILLFAISGFLLYEAHVFHFNQSINRVFDMNDRLEMASINSEVTNDE